MPRLPRVYIEGVLYYVTSRGGHNQNLFIEESNYSDYISLIDKYKKQYGFKLFAYVLMPTHVHLLIEVRGKVHISSIMHDINSLYTKMFNSRYNKKGHLFQERFRAVFAEKEEALIALVRHIHLNPVRAKLVADVGLYPYSSYQQFLNPDKRAYPDIRDEAEEVFRYYKEGEASLESYTRGITPEESAAFRKKLHKIRFLGSKRFAEGIKKIIEETIIEQKKVSLPRRVKVIYALLAATTVLILGVAVYFYRQNTAFRSEYQRTLALYNDTLDMLNRERDKAFRENRDVEEYAWKIRLTEKFLADFKQEREIDGYTWSVEFTPMGAPLPAFSLKDKLIFKQGRFASDKLTKEGFSPTSYTKAILANGNVRWESIQTHKELGTASWRGEWDGEVMKGILSRRQKQEGKAQDFSFISVGLRARNR